MVTNDKIIDVVKDTAKRIINQVNFDKNQSALMENPKHKVLIERYAKVLSNSYVLKVSSIYSAMLTNDLNDEFMLKVEKKVQGIENGFPKDMDVTLKSVKKYFGHAYADECLINVTNECFLDEFNFQMKELVGVDIKDNVKTEDFTKISSSKEVTA